MILRHFCDSCRTGKDSPETAGGNLQFVAGQQRIHGPSPTTFAGHEVGHKRPQASEPVGRSAFPSVWTQTVECIHRRNSPFHRDNRPINFRPGSVGAKLDVYDSNGTANAEETSFGIVGHHDCHGAKYSWLRRTRNAAGFVGYGEYRSQPNSFA